MLVSEADLKRSPCRPYFASLGSSRIIMLRLTVQPSGQFLRLLRLSAAK